jgi:hypothetical protein
MTAVQQLLEGDASTATVLRAVAQRHMMDDLATAAALEDEEEDPFGDQRDPLCNEYGWATPVGDRGIQLASRCSQYDRGSQGRALVTRLTNFAHDEGLTLVPGPWHPPSPQEAVNVVKTFKRVNAGSTPPDTWTRAPMLVCWCPVKVTLGGLK